MELFNESFMILILQKLDKLIYNHISASNSFYLQSLFLHFLAKAMLININVMKLDNKLNQILDENVYVRSQMLIMILTGV